VAEVRAKAKPRLSREKLVKRLRESGFDIKHKDLALLEDGKYPLNYYQVTVLAGVLNTTINELLS